MPLYEVEHSIPLDKSRRDKLAQAITHIHTRKFATPSNFVSVRFTQPGEDRNYLGGKERAINRIVAQVRAGGNRKTTDFEDLAKRVFDAWNDIINGEEEKPPKDKELQVVLVMGTITAGVENGFLLPQAGKDAEWLQLNRPKFEQLAEQGDSDFISVVQEMRTREDLGGQEKP